MEGASAGAGKEDMDVSSLPPLERERALARQLERLTARVADLTRQREEQRERADRAERNQAKAAEAGAGAGAEEGFVSVPAEDAGPRWEHALEGYLARVGRFSPAARGVLLKAARSQEFAAAMDAELSLGFVPHCLAAYLPAALPPEQLQALAFRMEAQIADEVHATFKGTDAFAVHVTGDVAEARTLAVRAGIEWNLGGGAAAAATPVVYITEGSPLVDYADYFGFVNGCAVRQVPVRDPAVRRPTSGPACASQTMDLGLLAAMVDSDRSAGLAPCVAVATVGGMASFHMDDLWGLRKVCSRFGLWLHAEGSSVLFAAAVTALPAFALALFQCADSVADDPLSWLSRSQRLHPGSAGICLVRVPEAQARAEASAAAAAAAAGGPAAAGAAAAAAGDDGGQQPAEDHAAAAASQVLSAVSLARSNAVSPAHFGTLFRLWHRLLSCPDGGVAAEVDLGLTLCGALRRLIRRYDSIELAGPPPEHFPESVFFRVHTRRRRGLDLAGTGLNDMNRWLAARTAAAGRACGVAGQTCDGMAGFFYRPFADWSVVRGADEAAQAADALATQLRAFLDGVIDEVVLLERAVAQRGQFAAFLAGREQLEAVEAADVDGLVGLGAFRFVPEVLAARRDAHAPELNQVGHALAHRLAAAHGDVFGTALTREEPRRVVVVVRASALVAEEGGVDALCRLVQEAVDGLQLPDAVVDRIADSVRAGIRQAEERMRSSRDQAYQPDALIRSVPVVGNVWGWIAGAGGDGQGGEGDGGAGFDLRSGALARPGYRVAASDAGSAPAPAGEAGEVDDNDVDDDDEDDEDHAAAAAATGEASRAYEAAASGTE